MFALGSSKNSSSGTGPKLLKEILKRKSKKMKPNDGRKGQSRRVEEEEHNHNSEEGHEDDQRRLHNLQKDA